MNDDIASYLVSLCLVRFSDSGQKFIALVQSSPFGPVRKIYTTYL